MTVLTVPDNQYSYFAFFSFLTTCCCERHKIQANYMIFISLRTTYNTSIQQR